MALAVLEALFIRQDRALRAIKIHASDRFAEARMLNRTQAGKRR